MPPALYAHRLGRAYGPDSSATALSRALERPLDRLETDCCLTADGEPVLLHDPLLEVGTTLSGCAHERRAQPLGAGHLEWVRRAAGRYAMSEWLTVARTQDVPDGGLAAATLDGVRIVLANAGGEYRAVADECTHAGCSLADDGELEGDSVTCQCHGSRFDLSTGEAIGPPATEPVAVYSVRVEGDEIQVAPPVG